MILSIGRCGKRKLCLQSCVLLLVLPQRISPIVRNIHSRLSSILATNTLTLVFILGVSFTQVASLTGYFLLGVGCCAWITSATARIYGKRHTYVFGAILLVAGSIWGAVGSHDFCYGS